MGDKRMKVVIADNDDSFSGILKAYMAEGSTIFEGENLKYLQAIKRLIRH